MTLLDGKVASAHIKQSLAEQIKQYADNNLRPPHLAAILVGNNAASQTYVASKIKNCEELGIKSTLIPLNNTVTQAELIQHINTLNNDNTVDGILVQLPLPKHINEAEIINAILPSKDVDGFHPVNIGNMVIGNNSFLPATPYGILLLLQHYNIDTAGKHCVVIGRSNIVGKPMSILLSRNNNPGNCTVTLCHSRTLHLANVVAQADIIVAAIGIPHFVTADMVKPGAVVIDVGINSIDAPERKTGKRLVGDVAFAEVQAKASAITPVPGGVGLMTIAALLTNTIKAYQQHTEA
jgi:methylenetetrahydrofolate dehydrogenase (NADP+) / methenyltetrahydrofolate cyclohydrolase